MKFAKYITIFFAVAATVACVRTQPDSVRFSVSTEDIECGAEGGVKKVRIEAGGDWVASAGAPWITVSPANGRGSAECEIQIDSALKNTVRSTEVRIQETPKDGGAGQIIKLSVTQTGFSYAVSLEEKDVEIPNYEKLDKRKFDVKVSTNVSFRVKLKNDKGEDLGRWLKCTPDKIEFDGDKGVGEKGIRPRNVHLRFTWDISSIPEPRIAKVEFEPIGVTGVSADVLTVRQDAAEKIEIGARGDALALVGAARSIGLWSAWDISEPMSKWDGVTLWTEEDEEILKEIHEQNVYNHNTNPENPAEGEEIPFDINNYIGRVRSARFFMFQTKEILPFEIQYLSAAEELSFSGNANSFLYDLKPGEHIQKLTQLRRLSMLGFGLTELEPEFASLKNLESLDLAGNNFEKIPDVLTQENFPKLHSLVMNANQRNLIYDLSNTVKEKFGGFFEENRKNDDGVRVGCGIPERILLWENLDTLKLAVNYFFGEISDMEDAEGVKRYGDDPSFAGDSLTTEFIQMNLPRILPNAKCLTINYNRLSGKVPDWLLYHPGLDTWTPYTFIFSQEGTDPNGVKAQFSNEPVSLDDYGTDESGAKRLNYYEVHPYKKKK